MKVHSLWFMIYLLDGLKKAIAKIMLPCPSSTASIVSGDQQIDWKFSVNSNWDINLGDNLSETVADDGVVGMLSGISTGNAVGDIE